MKAFQKIQIPRKAYPLKQSLTPDKVINIFLKSVMNAHPLWNNDKSGFLKISMTEAVRLSIGHRKCVYMYTKVKFNITGIITTDIMVRTTLNKFQQAFQTNSVTSDYEVSSPGFFLFYKKQKMSNKILGTLIA